MFNPLSLKIDSLIEISLQDTSFKCKDIENFYDFEHLNSARYLLKDSDDFIEVYKDSFKNFHINYYSLIEKINFDLTFFALLGTQTLSYRHPKYKNNHIIYQKITYAHEKSESVKVLVESDDFILNNLKGYFQDANKNWYYLVDKYTGLLKKSINHQNKLFWEYTSDKDTILIEILSPSSLKKSKIFVYEKIKLKRKDLKISNPAKIDSIRVNYF